MKNPSNVSTRILLKQSMTLFVNRLEQIFQNFFQKSCEFLCNILQFEEYSEVYLVTLKQYVNML